MNRQKTEQKGRLIYRSISLYQISFMKMREIDISEVDGRVYEENCFHRSYISSLRWHNNWFDVR